LRKSEATLPPTGPGPPLITSLTLPSDSLLGFGPPGTRSARAGRTARRRAAPGAASRHAVSDGSPATTTAANWSTRS